MEHQRRRLLQARYRASAAGPPGPGSLGIGPAVYGVRSEPSEEAKLRDTEVELGRLRAAMATISDQLALVAAILNEPGKHLRLDRVSLTLDHMNIKVPGHLHKAADTLTFNDILIGGHRRHDHRADPVSPARIFSNRRTFPLGAPWTLHRAA